MSECRINGIDYRRHTGKGPVYLSGQICVYPKINGIEPTFAFFCQNKTRAVYLKIYYAVTCNVKDLIMKAFMVFQNNLTNFMKSISFLRYTKHRHNHRFLNLPKNSETFGRGCKPCPAKKFQAHKSQTKSLAT